MAMRQCLKILSCSTAIAVLLCASAAQAAFFGMPRALKYQLDRMDFGSSQVHFGDPALPPIGHSRFCLSNPEDCQVHSIDFRHRNIALTMERWNELNSVNREVNGEIEPYVPVESGATEEWRIAPQFGDCKDYAVTKRHELLARGWPSRALLLSEVVVPDGEHHLVLVVRTKDVDLVLDNLNANIRPIAMTYRQYQWVRIESPQNPKFWATVETPARIQTAAALD
jgi:predicted transglutaminase-like cysteine proteinase